MSDNLRRQHWPTHQCMRLGVPRLGKHLLTPEVRLSPTHHFQIVAWPNAYIYICFFFMMGRMYNNSLLATLNARSGGALSSQNRSHPADQSFDQLSRGGRPVNALPLNPVKGSLTPNVSREKRQAVVLQLNPSSTPDANRARDHHHDQPGNELRDKPFRRRKGLNRSTELTRTYKMRCPGNDGACTVPMLPQARDDSTL